jgi:hypothetical protein
MESKPSLRSVHIAGVFGVIACAIGLAEFPLWFIGGSMPQFWEAAALMTTVAGILIVATKALPRWTGWLALVTAAWNLAFVPTMYFGTDFTKFYSAAGDGPAAAAPLLFIIWIVATATCMIMKRRIEDGVLAE